MAGLAGGWRFGLLPLAALWIGVNTFGAGRIDAEIAERTRQALDRLGLRGVETQVDGRDVTLRGEVDERARAMAQAAVSGIGGVGDVTIATAPAQATPSSNEERPEGRSSASSETRPEARFAASSETRPEGRFAAPGAAPLAAAPAAINPTGDAGPSKPSATPPASGGISSAPVPGPAPVPGETGQAPAPSAAPAQDVDGAAASPTAARASSEAGQAGSSAPAKPVAAETAPAPASPAGAPDSGESAAHQAGAAPAVGSTSPEIVAAAPPPREATAAACQARMAELAKKQPIQFAPGSARLSLASAETLDALAAQANACPGVNFEVAGYTDDVGVVSENLELSRRRAENVLVYLVSAGGVDPQRLQAVGYGESRPLVANDNDENRAKNRRIEFNLK